MSRVVLSPTPMNDVKYRQLTGEEARAALAALHLTYIDIDHDNRVCALCKENMCIHGYYIYRRS